MCATVLSISRVKSLRNVAFDDSALFTTCLLHNEKILHWNFFQHKGNFESQKKKPRFKPFCNAIYVNQQPLV